MGRRRSGRRGGTVDTLHDAIRFHVPVLWIDAVAPFGWMVVRTEADIALAPGASRHVPVRVPAAEEESEALALAQALARIVADEVALPTARGARRPSPLDTKPDRRPPGCGDPRPRLFRRAPARAQSARGLEAVPRTGGRPQAFHPQGPDGRLHRPGGAVLADGRGHDRRHTRVGDKTGVGHSMGQRCAARPFRLVGQARRPIRRRLP